MDFNLLLMTWHNIEQLNPLWVESQGILYVTNRSFDIRDELLWLNTW